MTDTERRIRLGELHGYLLGFDHQRDTAVRQHDDGYHEHAFASLLGAVNDLAGAVRWLARAEQARQEEDAAIEAAILEQGRRLHEGPGGMYSGSYRVAVLEAARADGCVPGVYHIFRSCSWCDRTNAVAAATCAGCGHDAHRPRLECRCARCTAGRVR